jgi:hypothetical protein
MIHLKRDNTSSTRTTLRSLIKENRKMNIDRTNQLEELENQIKAIAGAQASIIQNSDFSELEKRLFELESTASRLQKEQKLLASLAFDGFKVRQSRIPEAHVKTFSWLFQASQESPSGQQVKFLEWIQDPNPERRIYWICGKAGSGKSTLMKYIYEHPETAQGLQHWAKSSRLITASFFFWNAGHQGHHKIMLQQSQEGLLRTLLYEILRKCPQLILTVIPEAYEHINSKVVYETQELWDIHELKLAFRNLNGQLDEYTSFCFFIDGLDEYYGEPLDLLDVVKELAASNNIKICASSRPWPVFKLEFDKYTEYRLHLQDLTSIDIALYVRNKLEESPVFLEASPGDDKYQELVMEIVERARGVFLWVYLVVRSLLTGLTNEDTIEMLQRRLRALPTELEPFFKLMMSSVEDFYQTSMAQFFLITLESEHPPPLYLYYFVEKLADDPNYTLDMELLPLNDRNLPVHSLRSQERIMETRLEARCKGLLEVSAMSTNEVTYARDLRQTLKTVHFLHRTVAEFLRGRAILEELQQKSGIFFQPLPIICRAFLGVLKTLPKLPDSTLDLKLQQDLIFYARKAEEITNKSCEAVVDELSRVSDGRKRLGFQSRDVPYATKAGSTVLWLCVQLGYDKFVQKALKYSPSLHQQAFLFGSSLAVGLNITKGHRYPEVYSGRVIHILLEMGADPNKDGIWGRYLSKMLHSLEDLDEFDEHCGIIEMLLKKGADPNVTTERGTPMWREFSILRTPRRTRGLKSLRDDDRNHILSLLFQNGANPNKFYDDHTVWAQHLLDIANLDFSFRDIRQLSNELKILINFGADLDVTIRPDNIECGRVLTIEEVIAGSFEPEYAEELLDSIRTKKSLLGSITTLLNFRSIEL